MTSVCNEQIAMCYCCESCESVSVCLTAPVLMMIQLVVYGNNNNNNNQDDIYSAVIMTTGHCESSLGSFDECRPAPSGRRPSD